MIRTATLDRNQKPTEEQIQQIREAANKEIIFDEDSPELTPAIFHKEKELGPQLIQATVPTLSCRNTHS